MRSKVSFIIIIFVFFSSINSYSKNLNNNILNEINDQLSKKGIFNTSVDLNVRISIPEQNGFSPVDLWATIIRPAGDKKLPTIVIATPYRREMMLFRVLSFLSHDYNIISIDLRGTGSSAGSWTSFDLVEQYDVKYLIDEWIPAQEWSDGKVGMYGPSYMGIIQMLAAGLIDRDENGEPVHLKALFPIVTLSDIYKDILMQGGNINLEFVPLWIGFIDLLSAFPSLLYLGEDEFPNMDDIKEATDIWQNHLSNISTTVDWVMNTENEYDGYYFDQKSPMMYWPIKPPGGWGYPEGDNGVIPRKLPVFNVGGWFDLFTRGSFNNYQYGLSEHSNSDKAMIIGDIYHVGGLNGFAFETLKNGELPARWFDWKIKGKKDSFMTDFPVVFYVMGEDRWRAEKDWPLPESRVEEKTFYLSKHNPSPIEGDWYTDEPWYRWFWSLYNDNNFGLVEEYSDIEFNRSNPELLHEVFSKKGKLALHGARSRSNARWSMGIFSLFSEVSKHLLGKNIDEGRFYEDERFDEKDCLTFTTEPLAEDIEIVGPLKVTFWAKTDFIRPMSQWMMDKSVDWINDIIKVESSLILKVANRKDVQWVVGLNNVFPDGRARNVTSGWLNAWHRPYDPDESENVYEHHVDPNYVPFDPFYNGPDKNPKPIVENDLYQYVVELWPISNVFKKGHRIRVSISGSDFPHLVPVLKPSVNTIVIDEDHLATVDFKITNKNDEGETWKWIDDIDEYLMTHKDESSDDIEDDFNDDEDRNSSSEESMESASGLLGCGSWDRE